MSGAAQSHLTLREGTPVMASDGRQVGVVAHVLRDDRTGIFEGIVVDTGGLAGGHHFADAAQIAEIRDAVVLSLDGEAARSLPGLSERLAVADVDPRGVDEPALESRLRRAWDWVSGRY